MGDLETGYLRPDFDYDVFISYAHKDDQPVLGEKWVTELDNEIRTLVLEYLGQEPSFWRDPTASAATAANGQCKE